MEIINKMMKAVLVIFIATGLTACAGAQLHDDMGHESNQVQKKVELSRDINQLAPVIHVDVPRQGIVTKKFVKEPDWYDYEHQTNSAGMPFYVLVDSLAKQHQLAVSYSPDIDLQFPVFLNLQNGTVKGVLEALASTTGYAYEVHGRTLRWSKYLTERFDLSHVGGSYEYQIGSESKAGLEDSDNKVLGSNASQFNKVASTDTNLFEEVVGTLTTLVGQDGTVVLSQSTSSVTVKATPVGMKSARSYIQSLNRSLSTQIELDVKVLKFRHSDVAESGINWNLVRESASNKLTFNGALNSDGNLTTAPALLQANVVGGVLDTSSLLIRALQEQGTVSVVTEPRILTQVNRVAELKMGEQKSYVAKTVTSTDESGKTSTSIESGTVVEGYSIYVLSNVDANDQIYLHMSSMLSDILSLDAKTVGDVSIEAPNVHENQFSQTVVLQPGQTVVVNSLKQVVRNSNASSPTDAFKNATYKNGQHVIEETVVLVTPTIIRGRF